MSSPPSDPQPLEPDDRTAGAAAAGRADSSTVPLLTIIGLLAAAAVVFGLRDLNRSDTAISDLDVGVAQPRSDVDESNARFDDADTEFVKLKADINARFDEMDARFDELEANMDARFDELEANMDARFDEMDARFDELEAGQQEIALTLTALVAYLRADEGVDAALAGRVLDPAAGAGSSTDSG